MPRRFAEVGRLRMGHKVPTWGDKTRPASLECWRLTSADPDLLNLAAGLWGGDVQPWPDAPAGPQFELYTTSRKIPVLVPPQRQLVGGGGPQTVTQWMELWRGGGCQRRCDGELEQIQGTGCACPPDLEERLALAADGKACKEYTRVSVFLADLPGWRIWRVEGKGYYAATELAASAEYLASFGVVVPATLTIDQRRVKRPGQPPREFVVPVLDPEATPRELAAATGAAALRTLLPPARALPAPPPGYREAPEVVRTEDGWVDADTGEAVDEPPGWEERAEQEAANAGRARVTQTPGAGEREPVHAGETHAGKAGDRHDPAPGHASEPRPGGQPGAPGGGPAGPGDPVAPHPGDDARGGGAPPTSMAVRDLAQRCGVRLATALQTLNKDGGLPGGITSATVLEGDGLDTAEMLLLAGKDGGP